MLQEPLVGMLTNPMVHSTLFDRPQLEHLSRRGPTALESIRDGSCVFSSFSVAVDLRGSGEYVDCGLTNLGRRIYRRGDDRFIAWNGSTWICTSVLFTSPVVIDPPPLPLCRTDGKRVHTSPPTNMTRPSKIDCRTPEL